MGSAIRCVAFDAVGTLIYPVPSVAEVYWRFGNQYGSQYDQQQVQSRFYRSFKSLALGPDANFSTSEAQEFERWRQIVYAVFDDISQPEQCFLDLHEYFATPSAWRCFDDVAETMAELSLNNLEVVIASNFDSRLHTLCDHLPELRAVRRRFISSTVGWHKPSPNFFTTLTAQTGFAAQEILMVGDDRENDQMAAERAGLQAILIDRNGDNQPGTISDLRQVLRLVLQ